ncbi:MFS transporter [Streptomyces sp. DG2A-72]|uniref:MFS transporter n=1 Tax=Streptomyces sp. DG2A-72 TaxID=3051386 RepID=UPI00265C3A2E|nr:MFS transporter [Streptomyces sp. DG2A-72]MDO0932248.1 MFS transporter [Streptomyces sp. DG2A-72]
MFSSQFFDGLGEDSLVISFAAIGMSCFFRPVGAALAGHLGDRLGRRAMLIATLLLMGVSTTLIGLVPSSASIGMSAPVILVLLRILQGLSAGGEWGGAALISVEHAPAAQGGRFGSYPQLGAPLGLLLANGAPAAVTASPRTTSSSLGLAHPLSAQCRPRRRRFRHPSQGRGKPRLSGAEAPGADRAPGSPCCSRTTGRSSWPVPCSSPPTTQSAT